MSRWIVTLAIVAALVPMPTAAQSECRFVLGFAELRQAIGTDVVGVCLEDEWADPDTGDVRQRTECGELIWRAGSNTTAFTNGAETWVRGPLGLQRRANTERFSWEPSETAARPSPTPTPPVVVAPAPRPAQGTHRPAGSDGPSSGPGPSAD